MKCALCRDLGWACQGYDGRPWVAPRPVRAARRASLRILIDEDLKTFIIAANVKRQHMTSAQLAMAMAMMYPEPTPGKTMGLGRNVDRAYLYRARTVLKHSLSMAKSVLAGNRPLNQAYEQAKAAQALASTKD